MSWSAALATRVPLSNVHDGYSIGTYRYRFASRPLSDFSNFSAKSTAVNRVGHARL
jgi:hypothetical protein